MKKKSVVAGIAQKGGGKDGAVGYGHAGDNGEVRPKPENRPTFPFSPCQHFLALPPLRPYQLPSSVNALLLLVLHFCISIISLDHLFAFRRAWING